MRYYEALGRSGQSRFYEASDWEHARVWCQFLSDQLISSKPSAMMMTAWDSAMARLLVTEGDRRRMRLELQRGDQVDEDEVAAVASMAAWRDALRPA